MIQISDTVRIVRTDKYNLQIEEYRPVIEAKTKTKKYEWCRVGYYGNLKSAILGVIKHCGKELPKQELKGWKSVVDKLEEYQAKIENGTLKQEKTCTYQEYNHLDWSYWECSNCGEPFCFNNECTPEENQYHYCPNCGARITEYKELEDER